MTCRSLPRLAAEAWAWSWDYEAVYCAYLPKQMPQEKGAEGTPTELKGQGGQGREKQN